MLAHKEKIGKRWCIYVKARRWLEEWLNNSIWIYYEIITLNPS